MHSKEFVQRMKNQLEQEKERLQEELDETAGHTEIGEDEDDTAFEDELDQVNQDIIEQLKEDLQKIDQAMKRIEDETYGICAVGGEDIPEARLEVIPWAETCLEHEAK